MEKDDEALSKWNFFRFTKNISHWWIHNQLTMSAENFAWHNVFFLCSLSENVEQNCEIANSNAYYVLSDDISNCLFRWDLCIDA